MARVFELLPEAMTDGEKTALAVLRKLPRDWMVIANKLLIQNNARSKELDFIVVGQRNVFAIEEKAWEGRFRGSQSFWIREDGHQRPNPLNLIELKAKALRGQIHDAVASLNEVEGYYVHPLVLLTATNQTPQIDGDPRADTRVVLLQDLLTSLKPHGC
jgi:hypothetical protein